MCNLTYLFFQATESRVSAEIDSASGFSGVRIIHTKSVIIGLRSKVFPTLYSRLPSLLFESTCLMLIFRVIFRSLSYCNLRLATSWFCSPGGIFFELLNLQPTELALESETGNWNYSFFAQHVVPQAAAPGPKYVNDIYNRESIFFFSLHQIIRDSTLGPTRERQDIELLLFDQKQHSDTGTDRI